MEIALFFFYSTTKVTIRKQMQGKSCTHRENINIYKITRNKENFDVFWKVITAQSVADNKRDTKRETDVIFVTGFFFFFFFFFCDERKWVSSGETL